MKTRYLLLSFLFVVLIATSAIANDSTSTSTSNGETGYGIAAGIGFTEAFLVGAFTNIDQHELGFTIGHPLWMLTIEPTGTEITGTAYYKYHFGGKSKNTNVRPIYVQSGLHFWKYQEDYFTSLMTHLMLRIGAEYNMTENLGIDFSLGGLFLIGSRRIDEIEYSGGGGGTWNFDFSFSFYIEDFPILPSAKINLFYRL